MRIIGKKILEKLKRKNKGNIKLSEAVNQLIYDIEKSSWKSPDELYLIRKDADCVHNDGFYFFDISIHRTMILIEFEEDEATVVWVGNHKEYESTFRNNKRTIKKWLRAHNWID